MDDLAKKILELADGELSIPQIAERLGTTYKRVKSRVRKHNMPRRPVGAPPGERNPSYIAGRRIDLAGYAVVPLKRGDPHPHQRIPPHKKTGFLREHRLIMERHLGRYLEPTEVVDHIDGLTLHNTPENLRLFASNGEHLAHTISGVPKQFSSSGHQNIGARTDRGREIRRVDIYQLRLRRGDVRLRAILLAALQLGIDSPYLLGTHHHLEKAGIDPYQRSNLEHGLAELDSRWEADLLL